MHGEPITIPTKDGSVVGCFSSRAAGAPLSLLCRGLTGDLTRSSAIDELAAELANAGWSSVRFDFRGRGQSSQSARFPTVSSMVEDLGAVLDWIKEETGSDPDAVLARGFGSRLALECLESKPHIPLVMWAPILWLQTSLELRGRFHEMRRRTKLVIDGTEIKRAFLDSLCDPDDGLLRSWIAPGRPHVIIHPQEDKVVPLKLARELWKIMQGAGAKVAFVKVPGPHPHPDKNVRGQIQAVLDSLLSQHSKGEPE